MMPVSGARSGGQEQGAPSFDGPGERSDDHVGPVGLERVERRVQRVGAVFELLDEVFLRAAAVGFGDHLLLCQRAVVGDVKEEAKVGADAELPALLFDELAQDNDAVAALGAMGLILEFSGVLGDETLVEVATLADDLLFDAGLLGASTSELLMRLADQLGVVAEVDVLRAINEGRVGIVAEHEADASVVPV